ncbi:hypothetical protein DHEL01_v211000 [Diaporthe helianthi]|uniref:Uncharacterized protein n=1 Tax=Diaporthe helianthi TaxID=158607 RepID=A0A2P5HK42_DIAHE|nr:hypothetical protein DHEL01_v211000 [Diaporthe helianthi]
MPNHGGNTTPSPSSKDDGVKKVNAKGGIKDSTKDGSPKTPTNVKNGKKRGTQIELTPIESLLFFNMVRFNGVRFRQILKKHGLMDQAPETPRSQAQKRKATMKSEENVDDDEDVDSCYNPSAGNAKPGARKRSAPRTAGSRTKRTKARLTPEQDQDDEDAVAQIVGAAPSPASTLNSKTEIKAEGKPVSEPGSDGGIELLDDDGVAGAIDDTTSASPYEQSHGQAPLPQALGAGAAYLSDLSCHQSGLPAPMDEPHARELLHLGMVPDSADAYGSFDFGQRPSSGQVVALQARRHAQLQARHSTRFQAPQMLPYQMTPVMTGDNLSFGYIGPTQFSQHFPVGAYSRAPSFDQSQIGHAVGYNYLADEVFRGRLDGQDDWALDDRTVKREATPEVEEPGEVEWQRKDGDEDK